MMQRYLQEVRSNSVLYVRMILVVNKKKVSTVKGESVSFMRLPRQENHEQRFNLVSF